jgi:hypothetical protein
LNLGHCIEHFHAHAKLIEEQNQILELIRNDTIESHRKWLGEDSIKTMGPKIYVSATFDRKRIPNHLAEINNFFHIGLDILDEMKTAILNSMNASGKVLQRLPCSKVFKFVKVSQLRFRQETQISLICMVLRISQII